MKKIVSFIVIFFKKDLPNKMTRVGFLLLCLAVLMLPVLFTLFFYDPSAIISLIVFIFCGLIFFGVIFFFWGMYRAWREINYIMNL